MHAAHEGPAGGLQITQMRRGMGRALSLESHLKEPVMKSPTLTTPDPDSKEPVRVPDETAASTGRREHHPLKKDDLPELPDPSEVGESG